MQSDPALAHLVGQRIKVKCHLRSKEFITLVGECQFIGINPLHNQMQVTISRAPIWPVEIKNIQII